MKRFLELEITRQPGESNKAHRKRHADIAKQFFLRSEAHARLIEEKLPNVFRLSVHPQANWNRKMQVQIGFSPDHWATPWHNAAVYFQSNGITMLMHRKEAEREGYRLEFKDDKPWRYLAP